MTRRTSIDAYNTIKSNGLLSKRKWEVYTCLYEHGPLTQREATDLLKAEGSSITPRFAELERLGVIAGVGQKISSTGMTVDLYDVTDRIPFKAEKSIRHECRTCNGKGYVEESQGKLF